MAANPTLDPLRSQALPLPKWQLWAGRVIGGLPVFALVMSAAMKLSHKPDIVEMFTGKFGYPAGILTALAVLELTCAVLYVVPRTTVLGAILLTGYLGGAIATHVRVGDPFVIPLVLGVLLWTGLFLRDARLRDLLPLRKPARA
jgi:hypothetical protein